MRGGSRLLLGFTFLLALGCASGGGGGEPPRDAGTRADANEGQLDGHVEHDAHLEPDARTPERDSGTPPIGESDAGSSCSESPCRLVGPQCGCPAGQGCYVDNGGNRLCVTASAEQEGQECTGPCAPGNLCIQAGATSLCARFCETDAHCTGGAGSVCVFTLSDGSGDTLPGVKLCSTSCDPTGGGCPSGLACTIAEEEDGLMRTFTACREAGTGQAGASCTASSDCADGHFCATTNAGTQVCARFCAVGSGSGCPQGSCTAFEDRLLLGGVEYGYCPLP